MARIDCSNVLNYAKERKRMCSYYTKELCCDVCPLIESPDCCLITEITQESINIVQKWSDEHPVRDVDKEVYALKVIKEVWKSDRNLLNISYLYRDIVLDGTEIPELLQNLIERLEKGGADNG